MTPFKIELGAIVRLEGEHGTFRVKQLRIDGSVDLWGGKPGKERLRTVHPDRIKPPNRGDLAPGNANDYREKKHAR
jgi:hypothetical protein